jgi:small-conductance mechanosensitive channel
LLQFTFFLSIIGPAADASFCIGVTCDTSKQQLSAIPDILRETMQAQPDVDFDRAHFDSFGRSSLDFETVYIVRTPAYGACMGVQRAINMAVFERFESEGIEFAYPTQTLYLSRPHKTALVAE